MEDVSLNEKKHSEITELMETLRGNLDKVVQHGKRADAIVKNMLLHSREGSGDHRVVDINALVEESLNLAYHGARAEKQGFNIIMERSVNPDTATQADVFPQDITRVLLNLISNGFYAATEPRLMAMATNQPWWPRHEALGIEWKSGFGLTARVSHLKDIQPVFHNQARRRRNWTWALHLSRHHCQTAWWLNRGRYETW